MAAGFRQQEAKFTRGDDKKLKISRTVLYYTKNTFWSSPLVSESCRNFYLSAGQPLKGLLSSCKFKGDWSLQNQIKTRRKKQ